MAMSLLPLDPAKAEAAKYTVEFTASDFLQCLCMEDGSKTRDLILRSVCECSECTIKISDNKNFTVYPWFSKCGISAKDNLFITLDKIKMSFNPLLAEAIGDFRKQYAKINLKDFGKLQGKYAIRIYEFCLSFKGYAGKEGNAPAEWFTPCQKIEDIRILFDVDPKKYKVTGDFRKFVIDNPVEEINRANIGIRIEVEYRRERRKLAGIIFNCRYLKKDEPIKIHPATETGKAEEKLINDHLEEFEELKKKALKEQPALTGLNYDREKYAEDIALEILRNNYSKKKQLKK
jgi:plasmid replication initiation protein